MKVQWSQVNLEITVQFFSLILLGFKLILARFLVQPSLKQGNWEEMGWGGGGGGGGGGGSKFIPDPNSESGGLIPKISMLFNCF